MGRELQVLPALVQHHAPGRRGRLRREAEERERALGEHGPRQCQAHLHDERGQKVRDDVPEDDAGARGPDGARGLDEVTCLEGQDGTADDPHEDRRVHDRDRDDHVPGVGAERGDDPKREQDRRKCEEDIHDSADCQIHETAHVARDEAEQPPGGGGRRDRQHRDLHRQAGAEEHAAEEIAP